MTATPKPPEGYETWLDWLVGGEMHGDGIDAARAELAALRADHAAAVRDRDQARRFVQEVLECSSWVGSDLGGGDAQDLAEELGLIRKVRYDPAEHGEPWRRPPRTAWPSDGCAANHLQEKPHAD